MANEVGPYVKTGMRVQLYSIAKRRNSTKVPNEIWFRDDSTGNLRISAFCVWKNRTDLFRPVILMALDRENETSIGSGDDDANLLKACNYARVDGYRYYWIVSMYSVSRDHWEIVLDADPLATFRHWIGETKVFAEYTSKGNIEIIDGRLPRKTNGRASSVIADSTFFYDKGEVIICGIIGKGGYDYYALDWFAYQTLLSNVRTGLDAVWDSMPTPTTPKWSSTSGDTASNSGLNAIASNIGKLASYLAETLELGYEQLKTMITYGLNKEDIVKNIFTAIYYPYNVTQSITTAAVDIYLGELPAGVQGKKLNGIQAYSYINMTVPSSLIPTSPAWLGRNEFTHWNLYVPYFGNIEIPADLIRNGSSQLALTCNLNLATGQAILSVGIRAAAVAQSSITLGTSQAQLGGQIGVATSYTSPGKAVSSLAATILSAAVAVGGKGGEEAGGAVIKAAGIASTIQSAMQFSSAITPVGTCIGGGGGSVYLDDTRTVGQITLSKYTYGVSMDDPNALGDTIGMPYFDTIKVKSCGGYIKCTGASVEIPGANADEIDTINKTLNGGLYYE